jgi:two-component system phosphate regulon response regulator PhoB
MSHPESAAAAAGPKPRVVVVEDHPDTQSLVVECLEQWGFEVSVASDGIAAMEMIRERRPDLVYLDMNLPNISGYEVCEQIRAEPNLGKVIILMTSARSTVDVQAHALEAGADAFLPKPYTFDRLMSQVQELLTWQTAPTLPLADPLGVPGGVEGIVV